MTAGDPYRTLADRAEASALYAPTENEAGLLRTLAQNRRLLADALDVLEPIAFLLPKRGKDVLAEAARLAAELDGTVR